jgi:hypothetical protein
VKPDVREEQCGDESPSGLKPDVREEQSGDKSPHWYDAFQREKKDFGHPGLHWGKLCV